MGVKVCPRDSEPVIFTFKNAGAEYLCVICNWQGDVLSPREIDNPTQELIERQAELQDVFHTYEGIESPDQTNPKPVCVGCGATAEGYLDHSGKPPHWYQRTIKGVTEHACSRGCIPDGLVMPW